MSAADRGRPPGRTAGCGWDRGGSVAHAAPDVARVVLVEHRVRLEAVPAYLAGSDHAVRLRHVRTDVRALLLTGRDVVLVIAGDTSRRDVRDALEAIHVTGETVHRVEPNGTRFAGGVR